MFEINSSYETSAIFLPGRAWLKGKLGFSHIVDEPLLTFSTCGRDCSFDGVAVGSSSCGDSTSCCCSGRAYAAE